MKRSRPPGAYDGLNIGMTDGRHFTFKDRAMTIITHEDWLVEGKRRFGPDNRYWRFVCPSCGAEQTAQDFLDCGVDPAEIGRLIGFSCIGRFAKDKGCDWSLGGLFKIHKVEVAMKDCSRPVFEFAGGPFI